MWLSTLKTSLSLPAVTQCFSRKQHKLLASTTQTNQLSTSLTIATSNSVPFCYCTSLCPTETPWNVRSQAEVLCCALESPLWCGRNFIVEVCLSVRTAYLTTAWKNSSLFIRNPIHWGPSTLTTDSLATQTFVNYPPYFIPGTEVTEEQVLSFSSSLSKDGRLFVYAPCYLVIRTNTLGQWKEICVCGVHLRVSLSRQPPSCEGISCHRSWAFFLSIF